MKITFILTVLLLYSFEFIGQIEIHDNDDAEVRFNLALDSLNRTHRHDQSSFIHWLGNEGIDVFFNFSSDTMIEGMNSWLEAIRNFLVENDSLKFEVGVHRDTRGGDYYSCDLTASRAKAIKNYLIKNGIDQSRIEAKGYGASEPLISDADISALENNRDREEAHARNRRVTFRFK